jgi:hypothetical protein
MNSNHLLIGLGGTGGKIIRAFRKTIFQEFRKEDPEGVNVGYLYVDSSNEMMSLDDPSWKILGTSVQLNKKSQLLIQEADLTARLENINNYPGIKPWIGSTDQWKDILGSIIGVTLGGQKRRLGRFLFACKCANYRDQVQSLVRDLQASGTTDITFHICCGLAGGTGSGSVVDAIAQVRDLYPDSRRFKILVYALLPETHPNPNWDTGNYHSNGYAALLELNALSASRYEPVDLTGVKGRLKLSDPFNGCYLFTNENENGLTVNVDKELPGIVADFLYEKTVASRNVAWPTLGRMENAENGDGSPEKAPTGNQPERSKRFLTFGIKRLAIPEEEIGEYLSYNFARQAALQLEYNTWSDTAGFTDDAKNQDFHEFVSQKEVLYNWALTDDHLTLSSGILAEDASNKKWKPINNEWQDVLPNFKSVVRERKPETWLDELAKLCEKRFDQDYRGLGVRAFYKAKLKAKKEHANEIRRRVETDLFNDWKNGSRSVIGTSRLLGALIDSTGDRLQGLETKLTQAKDNEEEAGKRVQANARAWSNMGFVSKTLLHKPDSILDAQADALQEQYIYRTRIEALLFARQVGDEVIGTLTDLKSEVDRCASTVSEAIKKYNDRISGRITDGGAEDLRQQLVRFYRPDLVRSVTQSLIKNEDEQRTQANRVRQAIVGKLGDNPAFHLFNERFTTSDFLDLVDKEAAASARIAHNNLIQNRKDRLLGVSIIEKLKERYGGDSQELKSFLTELVSHAGNYLAFDQSEKYKSGPGIPAGAQTAVSKTSIIMPRATQEPEFTAKLKSIFQGTRTNEVEIIDGDTKPNEIVIISLTNLFPLRYISQAAFLKQRFDIKVAGPSAARAKLELLGEGDGSQLPSLFVPVQEEVMKSVVPYLLLAQALGLVQEAKTVNGGTELVIVAKDEYGFDTDPITLGKALSDTGNNLDVITAERIKDYVQKLMSAGVQQGRREELQKAIVTAVEAVKTQRSNNPQDEVYRRFLDAGKRAVAILRGEG